ncbi:signal recognition particle subunit SRP72-like [Cyclospora cayetanensis]|uniref:Signal recognition particle subunit SRP72-like n=1 Tax=Cyclospora cayetanensis TaxID=88456 RepID=A0A6P6S2P4_9EIME|nr:signal recognition particle subunit SRP72-like [Cyclospora cayetanensis]
MRYLPQSVNLIDGEEVEMRRLPPTTRGRRCPLATPGEAAQEGAGSHLAERRKRKKKIRYPKGWDPSKPQLPPDPERWKPKHERSGYKKMLRRRKECGRGGAQGTLAPGAAEATTGFRETGPTTAKTKAATDGSTARTQSSKRGLIVTNAVAFMPYYGTSASELQCKLRTQLSDRAISTEPQLNPGHTPTHTNTNPSQESQGNSAFAAAFIAIVVFNGKRTNGRCATVASRTLDTLCVFTGPETAVKSSSYFLSHSV